MPRGKKGRFEPPVSAAQFARMFERLAGHLRGLEREASIRSPGFAEYRMQRLEAGEALDEKTTKQIADALYRLRALYAAQARAQNAPNRRATDRDLQDAVNAGALIDFYGVDPERAVLAIAGKAVLPVERDSALKTLKARRAHAIDRGVFPQWHVIAAARARLLAEDSEE